MAKRNQAIPEIRSQEVVDDIEVPVYSIPISSTMLDHHVQRSIKEYEDNVPLENCNEDNNLYPFVKEVVNRVKNIQRAASCSSVPPFPPKATVLSHVHPPAMTKNNQTYPEFRCQPDWDLDGIFAEFSRKSNVSSCVPGKPTDLPDPDQEIDSYPKVSLVEPSSEQPDGGGICKSKFKKFVVEDYPHPKDEDSVCLSDFNEDHHSYPRVVEYVNLALEDYNKQTELIYELVEIVKVSVTGLGGFLYHITFKAMSPQKELATFEAEVFNRISKKEVWRVGIRKPGSDWFDGKLYWPKYDPSD